MTDDDNKELEEILAKIEAERPEFERIMAERSSSFDTGRKKNLLCQIPSGLDFEVKDGHTIYEVAGHFNPEDEESIFTRIISRLGYSFTDTN